MCGPLFSCPPHIKPCWPPENIVPKPNPALLCPTMNGKVHGRFYYANITKNISPFRDKSRFVNSVNSIDSCLKFNRKKKQKNGQEALMRKDYLIIQGALLRLAILVTVYVLKKYVSILML